MTRRQALNIAFFAIFLGLLYQLGMVLAPFLAPILWAMILANVGYPLYERLVRQFRDRPTAAAAVMTVGVLCIVVAPALYIMSIAVREGVALYEQATQWIKGGGLQHLGEVLSRLPWVGGLGQQVVGRLIVENGDMEGYLMEGGKSLAAYVAMEGGEVLQTALAALTGFAVMLFTLFFCFRDGRALAERVYAAMPMEEAYKRRIFDRLNTAVTAVVRGTLLTAVAQGMVAGLVYAALGVPIAVLLGALTALLSLLPFGGTAFVWGPLAVYYFATASYVKGFVLLAVGGSLVAFMDNLLYPLLVGVRTKLPVALLFFTSLGGMAYYGFLGLFLGPILLAVVMAVFDIYEEEYGCDPEHRLIVGGADGRAPLAVAAAPVPVDHSGG